MNEKQTDFDETDKKLLIRFGELIKAGPADPRYWEAVRLLLGDGLVALVSRRGGGL